jgi:hypothetical protein
VIVQRAQGELDDLAGVAAAVKAGLEKGGMTVIRSETSPMQGKPLPVQYCGEIIDVPSVRTAINQAIKKLEPSYRTQ